MRTPVLAVAALCAMSAGAREGTVDANPVAKPDATLERTTGERFQVASARGIPLVLFYEDKDSIHWNETLKQELVERGQRMGLADAVRVIPVANVAGYNFFPARQFALTALRGVEKKLQVQMWLDWTGALQHAPWGLAPAGSSVVLLDAEGTVRFSQSGKLSPEARARFFQALAPLVTPGDAQARPEGRHP